MKYNLLGSSGTAVSPLCLGTMMFGGPTSEKESLRIIDHASDHGVNFIDTADIYEQGRSEIIVGMGIHKNREKWILATKLGNAVNDDPNGQALSRKRIMEGIDQSLYRLNTDYVDIYYLHKPDFRASFEEIVLAMGDLIRSGKIRHFAVSNLRAWQITALTHLCRQYGVPQPACCQPYYNLLNRESEVEVLPACRHFNIGVVPYSPIARGVLTGKYTAGVNPDKDTRAGRNERRIMQSEWREDSLIIAQKIKQYIDDKDINLAQFAFAWVLSNKSVTSTIAGPRTFDQWTDYFPALEYTCTSEDEAFINDLIAPGHASTQFYSDPAYPIEGRFAKA